MGSFVADAAIKQMVLAGKAVRDSKVVILGLTFKENCPDTRNSKVVDVIRRLEEYGVEPTVIDPWADPEIAKHEYGVDLKTIEDAKDADCIIVAVGHEEFKNIGLDTLKSLYKNGLNDSEKVLIDVKGLFQITELTSSGIKYWRL